MATVTRRPYPPAVITGIPIATKAPKAEPVTEAPAKKAAKKPAVKKKGRTTK